MQRFVVTGAAGFLGNVVVKELLSRNYKVKVLVLENEDLTAIKDLDIEIAKGDIRDKDFLSANITATDIVLHMAGIVDIASEKNDLLYDVNVNGTKNIVDVCKEKNVEKLVYTSSVHVIDPTKNNQLMLEPNEFDDKILVGNYAKTKAIATKYVFEASKNGLNVVVVYPSGIIGPFDYRVSNTGQVIVDYINKKLYAYVKGGYNFVDVRDVAHGVIEAAFKGESGEGYILSGHMITIKQMIEILNKKLGRKKLPPKLALWFIKMFAKLSELYYKIRRKKPIFSAYSLETLNVNANFSNEKAKAELGFATRPVEETLFDAVDWFKENKPEIFISDKKKKKLEKLNKKSKLN